MEEALRAPRALLQLRRQGREELQARTREHATEAELGSRRGRGEECLGFGSGQPGELRSVVPGKAIAAGRPSDRFDGNARRRERFHVTVDGPNRDREVLREFRRGELPAQLQVKEERDEPSRPHRASPYMTEAGMYMP